MVKIRDSFATPAAAAYAAVDGVAGNVTVGLHMIVQTVVTANGESAVGSFTYSPWIEFTAAGSKKATVTIPVYPINPRGDHAAIASAMLPQASIRIKI